MTVCTCNAQRAGFVINPDQAAVVAFFGDSLMHQDGYVQWVEALYNLRFPGNRLTFLNKGIGGDTAHGMLRRFESELVNDPCTPNADYVVMTCGYNDLFWVKEEQREEFYGRYYTSVAALIDTCRAHGMTPILLGFVNYDDYEGVNYQHTPVNTYLAQNLKGLNDRLREIAREKNAAFLDTFTIINGYAAAARAENDQLGAVYTQPDRVHQTNEGRLLKAAVSLAELGVDPTVASVELAKEGCRAVNCEISHVELDGDRAAYTYAPHALPIPYTEQYKTVEQVFHTDLTGLFNKETVTVKGLKHGRYALAFDGTTVGEYTAEELALGVNIALCPDNPSQKNAMQVYDAMKRVKEQSFRYVACVRFSLMNAHISLDDTEAVTAFVEKQLADVKPDVPLTYNQQVFLYYRENVLREKTLFQELLQAKQQEKDVARLGRHAVTVTPLA